MALPRTPKWITFDCYGTLIDTRGGYLPIWRDLLTQKGLGPDVNVMDYVKVWGEEEMRLIAGPYKKYREILKESVEATLKRCNLPVAPGDGERMANAYGTFLSFPDVTPVLSQLKKQARLAIISNIDNDIIAQTLTHINVKFDGVFTAENCKAYKPSRVPFEYALKHIGVPPQDILHVAFGYQFDLPAACEMGFMTVWVNRRNMEMPPGAKNANLIMPNLVDLPGLIGFQA